MRRTPTPRRCSAVNFYNFPDEKNTYAPPMFRGAGNTWMYKLKKIAG